MGDFAEAPPGVAEFIEALGHKQPSPEPPRRRWWLILAAAAVVMVVVVTAVGHWFGTGGLVVAGLLAAGAVVLWRLPFLRRHFTGGRRVGRSFTGARRFTTARRQSGGGARRGLGFGKIGGKGRAGAGTGGAGRKGLGALSGRKRGSTGAGAGGGRKRGLPGGKRAGQGGAGSQARRGLLGRLAGKTRSGQGAGSTGGRRGALGKLLGGKRGLGAGGSRRPFGKLLGGRRPGSASGRGLLGGKARGGGSSAPGKRGLLRGAGRKLGGGLRRGRTGGTAAKTGGAARRGLGRLIPRLGTRTKPGAAGGAKTGRQPGSRRSPAGAGRAAGRSVRSAWNRARRTTGRGKPSSGWRKAAEIAGAGALLPAVGVVAGARRLWAWWRKHRRAALPAAEPEAVTAPESEPQAEPQPGPPVKAAGVTFTGTTGTKGKPMTHVEAATEAVLEHIGGFSPESGADLDRFLHDLSSFFDGVSSALHNVAEHLGGDKPVHPAVFQHLREMAATQDGMREYAEEAYRIHRQAHEKELERLEQPRPGEAMWDVNAE